MLQKALIVDDEPLFREGLSKMITDLKTGWTVCGLAENGKSGLEIFVSERPRLIITDIKMPIMDGVSFAKEVRSLCQETIIVFLTGYQEFEYAKQGIKSQVFDYLLKPCSKDQLILLFKKINASMGISDNPGDSYSKKAMAYVAKNYASDCSLATVAEALFISYSYLGKCFRNETGNSFSQYVMQYRLDKAMHKLSFSKARIYEVAASVGIDDSNYFATIFKRQFGVAPSDVRKIEN